MSHATEARRLLLRAKFELAQAEGFANASGLPGGPIIAKNWKSLREEIEAHLNKEHKS